MPTPVQATRNSAPDYGLDAPSVVRNLLVVAVVGIAIALGIRFRIIPPAVKVGGVNVGVMGLALGPGVTCGFTGLAMIWNSRIGKVRHRERILRRLPWTGAEQVLDVGCGRGLMLIGAAKHLTTGRATGIDVWRAQDLSNNSANATLANAAVEGVAGRVQVQTADMRTLPFPDGSIDVVVSCAAIHNLDAARDRATAISEIARVLKPAGYALIDDIRHFGEYRQTFIRHGCEIVKRIDNRFVSAFWSIVSLGSLRPVTLVAQKRCAAA